MKQAFVTIAFAFLYTLSYAQQPAQYSMYMFNTYGFNPAQAGLGSTLTATGGYRAQWVGLEGNPTSQFLNVTLPLNIVNSGVGLSFHNETLGARTGLMAKASYNYILKMGDNQLSLGLSGGIMQGSLDGNRLRTPTGRYEPNSVVNHNDGVLPVVSVNGMTPIFDVGVYFKSEKIEAGLSVNNVQQPKLSLVGGQTTTEVTLSRQYYAFVGGNFGLTDKITIHPSVLIKSDAIETQIDASTFFRFNDNIFLGTSFRGYNSKTIDAMTIFGGFKLNSNLTIAYSYDIVLSSLKVRTSASHEIALIYNLGKEFGKGKLPPIIYNPRF